MLISWDFPKVLQTVEDVLKRKFMEIHDFFPN